MNNQDKYRENFEVGRSGSKKAKRALDAALDIRKFEIELYWKRAAYFWTLIAVAFAGHFTILSARSLEKGEKSTYAFMIAVIGFVFTFAWFLANKGSKFWQENWENHVDMLEDAVIGPPLWKRTRRCGNCSGTMKSSWWTTGVRTGPWGWCAR